jgi:hypothetical protein
MFTVQLIHEVMKEYGSLFRYEIIESMPGSGTRAPQPPSPRSRAGPLAAECVQEGTADEQLGTQRTDHSGIY